MSTRNEDEAPFRMSFAELAVQLSITQTGSPRALLIEREIKRRVAEEHSALMRHQIAVGVVAGGLIAMASFYMGVAVSRAVPPHDHRVTAPHVTPGSLPTPSPRSSPPEHACCRTRASA